MRFMYGQVTCMASGLELFRVRVSVRVGVIISSVEDRGIERSGSRTLVDGVMTSRRNR